MSDHDFVIAYEKLREVEKNWDFPAARQRATLDAAHWMIGQTAEPRLQKLGRTLLSAQDKKALIAVMVPVERVAAKVKTALVPRITDAEILSRDIPADAPAAGKIMPLVLVADCIRSAFNLGGLLRSAECFGVERLVLCGYSAEPTNPQVAKAALGAETLVPWKMARSAREAAENLRAEGRKLVALETVIGAESLEKFAWPFPCALFVGNERFGLDAEILSMMDVCVSIKMFGRKNSLNVVSATAVALHSAANAADI